MYQFRLMKGRQEHHLYNEEVDDLLSEYFSLILTTSDPQIKDNNHRRTIDFGTT